MTFDKYLANNVGWYFNHKRNITNEFSQKRNWSINAGRMFRSHDYSATTFPTKLSRRNGFVACWGCALARRRICVESRLTNCGTIHTRIGAQYWGLKIDPKASVCDVCLDSCFLVDGVSVTARNQWRYSKDIVSQVCGCVSSYAWGGICFIFWHSNSICMRFRCSK